MSVIARSSAPILLVLAVLITAAGCTTDVTVHSKAPLTEAEADDTGLDDAPSAPLFEPSPAPEDDEPADDETPEAPVGNLATIGCDDSEHTDLREGIHAATRAGEPRVFVCAGTYEVTESIDLHRSITIVGDPADGGVVVISSATPVFDSRFLPAADDPDSSVSLGSMVVECAAWTEGTWDPEGGDGIELDGGDVSLSHIEWLGCGAAIVRSFPRKPTRLRTLGGAIIDGGQGMWLWGDGLDAEFDGLHMEGLAHEGIFFSPDARDRMDASRVRFDSITVVDNQTTGAGNLLDTQCIADAAPTMEVYDSLLVRNLSTTEDRYGAGGVFYLGSGCINATLHIEDSVVAGNVSVHSRSGGANVYDGRLVSVNTDWGASGTPADNLPADIYMVGAPHLADIDGVATFDCTAGVGCR